MERAARVELASPGWKPEARPLYHARSKKNLGGGDRIRTCLNSFWRRAPFLSGHHPRMAVATGVEPVSPDRQSGILPLDPCDHLHLRAQQHFAAGPSPIARAISA